MNNNFTIPNFKVKCHGQVGLSMVVGQVKFGRDLPVAGGLKPV